MRDAAGKLVLFTLHALDEMNADIPSADKWEADFRTRRQRE